MISLHPNIDTEIAENSQLIIIGAHDSSGGAGFASDAKAASALGVEPKYIMTHVTAQTHNSVMDILPVSKDNFEAQLKSSCLNKEKGKDFSVVIKLGMVAKKWMFEKVLSFLNSLKKERFRIDLVVDPIVLSSSSKSLMEDEALDFLKEFIFPKVTLLTPNLNEAEKILDIKAASLKDVEKMGEIFLSMGVESVLIKGGHFFEKMASTSNEIVQDYFCSSSKKYWLKAKKIKLNNQENPLIRGTGCFLATAIASNLSQGLNVSDSLVLGRCLLSSSIKKSSFQGDVSILGATNIESFSSCDFPIIEVSSNQEFYEKNNLGNRGEFQTLKDGAESFPWLYPIVDRAKWISKLANNQLKIIQLRVKDLEGEALEKEVEEAVYLSKKLKIKLFVNDYWELAIKYGAYGVHLGQEDLSISDLDKIRRKGLALGLSSHSYEE